MNANMLIMCDACEGTGKDTENLQEIPCPPCEGKGEIVGLQCPGCAGDGCYRCEEQGYLDDFECGVCDGRGDIEVPTRCAVCKGFKTVPSIYFPTENQ